METLTTAEWMRRRSGMFIGRTGDGSNPNDGIYTLLKEIINNAVDEYLRGHGNVIDIVLDEKKASIRDYGSGCPLDMATVDENWLKPCDRTICKTIGLDGCGLPVTNALSACFYICSFYDGVKSWDRYSDGVLIEHGEESSTEPNGTIVEFTPNLEVFEKYSFREGYVIEMVKLYSYMHKGLNFKLNGALYKSDGGLLDLVNDMMTEKPLYSPIHLVGEDIEIVLTHIPENETTILSYVNGHPTIWGGTHQASFKRALTMTFKKLHTGTCTGDCFLNGVFAAIRINVRYPYFVQAIKASLATNYMYQDWYESPDNTNPITITGYVSKFVKENLSPYLLQHEDVAEIIRRKRLNLKKR